MKREMFFADNDEGLPKLDLFLHRSLSGHNDEISSIAMSQRTYDWLTKTVTIHGHVEIDSKLHFGEIRVISRADGHDSSAQAEKMPGRSSQP